MRHKTMLWKASESHCWALVAAFLLYISLTVSLSAMTTNNKIMAYNRREPLWHIFVWTSAIDEVSAQDMIAIREAAWHSRSRPVLVFCGNTQCMTSVSAIPFVTVRRFRIADFVTSPMAPWFREHAIRKVIHGEHFERHMRAAARLAVLYEYGGLLHGNRVHMVGELPEHLTRTAWCYENINPSPVSHQGEIVMFAPKKDPWISFLINEFIKTAPTYMQGDAWPVDWTHDWLGSCPTQSSAKQPQFNTDLYFKAVAGTQGTISSPDVGHSKPLFGVLWYDERTKYLSRMGLHLANLGDEVQSLASLQWLPYINHKIERDHLIRPANASSNITVIMNAWYGPGDMVWPPRGRFLNPVWVSMHIHPQLFSTNIFSTNESLDYLRLHQPIGARDLSTLGLLHSHGVDADFSGCMTLTISFLGPPHEVHSATSECGILFVDVDERMASKFFPEHVLSCGKSISPIWRDDGSHANFDGMLRFKKAFKLLETYSQARIVVTTRLHAALPAASMGVPVILLITDSTGDRERFSGLANLVHCIRVSNDTVFSSFDMKQFDWDNPPSNPGASKIHNLRSGILNTLKNFHPHFRETLTTFSVFDV
jgi:hypothetical protein